jgi:hypothetical protein
VSSVDHFGLPEHERSPLSTVDGAAPPRWAFAASPHSFDDVLIQYPEFPGAGPAGDVSARWLVCFAPPGAILYDEQGLEAATWRRAYWEDEVTFVAGDAPIDTAPVTIAVVREEVPADFHGWVSKQSASHLQRLRAHASRNGWPADAHEAAQQLQAQLTDEFPDALREYYEATSAELDALCIDQPDDETFALVNKIPALTMRPAAWAVAVAQAACLLACFDAARIIHTPADTTFVVAMPLRPLPNYIFAAYGHLHVLIPFGFLGWVYFRRRSGFYFICGALLLGAALAAAPYLVFPHVYAAGQSVHVPQIAVPTKPALHLAVAVTVGTSGALLSRSRSYAWLWLTYPIVVVVIIVASRPTAPWLTIGWGVVAAATGWRIIEAVSLRWLTPMCQPRILAVRARLFPWCGKLASRLLST